MTFVPFHSPVVLRIADFPNLSTQTFGVLSRLSWVDDPSIISWRAHFSRVDKRPLSFDGVWASNVEKDISLSLCWLFWVCGSNKNVILLLKNTTILCDIFIKNERVWSAKSIRQRIGGRKTTFLTGDGYASTVKSNRLFNDDRRKKEKITQKSVLASDTM